MEIIYKTNKTFKNANAFLFGLKGFSTLEEEITLDELSSFSDKKVFLSLNKNMFNNDLKHLDNILSKIDNYNVSGILFYDLSVLSLAKKLNIKTPLIWNGDYLVANYKTCNFYEHEGVFGALIRPIITTDDIKEICKNTNLDIFVNGFGYQMIALSKRHLISNYFEYINEENNRDINYMIEKDDRYPIIEKEIGTKIYDKDVLNSIKYINKLKEAGVKYLILDNFMIEEPIFLKISKIYERAVKEDLTDEELISLEDEIKKLIPNSSTMFLDKKTVFKVKK